MKFSLPLAAGRVSQAAWRGGEWRDGARALPEETPIAFSYDGAAYAVMMASPGDLDDFAIGFSITEGIVAGPDDIEAIDIIPVSAGVSVRIWLRRGRSEALAERRRRMAGPLGCGMCGLESLEQANRAVPVVASDLRVTPAMIADALACMPAAQTLNLETRAVHAAAFWRPGAGLTALREDVGRHNAMDKLAGALAGGGIAPGSGILVLTSRISVEMVQKAAMIAAPLLVGVSAPTLMALRLADSSGITVAAIARSDGFELFTHPARVQGKTPGGMTIGARQGSRS